MLAFVNVTASEVLEGQSMSSKISLQVFVVVVACFSACLVLSFCLLCSEKDH